MASIIAFDPEPARQAADWLALVHQELGPRFAERAAATDESDRFVADNYADNTVIFMVDNQAKATGFTGLDPSVVAYISAATKRMFCSFRLAEQVALADSKYGNTVPKIDSELARMAQRASLNAARDCQ